jgi:hypothetical protein
MLEEQRAMDATVARSLNARMLKLRNGLKEPSDSRLSGNMSSMKKGSLGRDEDVSASHDFP